MYLILRVEFAIIYLQGKFNALPCMAQNIYKQKSESEVMHMPKTAFVLSNPRTKCIEKDKLEFFLNYLTVELMEECPQLDFPPVILSVVSIPNSYMVNVTYAYRYEVEK